MSELVEASRAVLDAWETAGSIIDHPMAMALERLETALMHYDAEAGRPCTAYVSGHVCACGWRVSQP